MNPRYNYQYQSQEQQRVIEYDDALPGMLNPGYAVHQLQYQREPYRQSLGPPTNAMYYNYGFRVHYLQDYPREIYVGTQRHQDTATDLGELLRACQKTGKEPVVVELYELPEGQQKKRKKAKDTVLR
ncbi:hypothetical protein RUND412_010060 [Rhizina undulata]